jgi:hypothetical protein
MNVFASSLSLLLSQLAAMSESTTLPDDENGRSTAPSGINSKTHRCDHCHEVPRQLAG